MKNLSTKNPFELDFLEDGVRLSVSVRYAQFRTEGPV